MKPLDFGRESPYELLRVLSQRLESEVLLLREKRGESPLLVMKRMRAPYQHQPAFRAQFEKEAFLLKVLDSPYVPSLIESGESPLPYLLLEYIDGLTLSELLQESQGLSMGLSAYLVREVARALEVLEEARDEKGQKLDLLHGDLNPNNLMLRRDGHLQVIDFGAAYLGYAGAARRGQDFEVRGSLSFMPREQVLALPLSKQADIFALGSLFYFLRLGRPFLLGGSPLAHMAMLRQETGALPLPYPSFSMEEKAFFSKTLAGNPATRYEGAQAAQEGLESLFSKCPDFSKEALLPLLGKVKDGSAGVF